MVVGWGRFRTVQILFSETFTKIILESLAFVSTFGRIRGYKGAGELLVFAVQKVVQLPVHPLGTLEYGSRSLLVPGQ